jgi:NTP pyrophosphatase (non-canonical NTP hydrolase)
MPTPSPLTIQAFQDYIETKYGPTDRARGAPATFVWLIEEIGELATAINETERGKPQDNLEEEMADVIAWVCTLANIRGVNLEAAIRKKYLNAQGGPEGVK